MKKLNVFTKREHLYNIFVSKGLLDKLDEFSHLFFNYKRVIIITDKNVAEHYLKHVQKQIVHLGCKTHEIIIEPGEKSKSLSDAEEIYHHLVEYNITRSDCIIALGGGVVGDLSGYCASTFLRGIDFMQIPTTLLAQVDSSIGGKVGINLSKGKNLIGSFYQPKAVLIDPNVLITLEDKYFNDGMAEVIKYGCIYDKELFQKLSTIPSKEELMNEIEDIIFTCCNIKKEVVEEDEREKRMRRILNFGHTLGHVIEAYYNYKDYSHGEAVAIGMYQITLMSEKRGITLNGTAEKIKEILTKYHLHYKMPTIKKEELLKILYKDKKFDGDKLNLVLLKQIGETEIIKVNKEKIEEYLIRKS